MSATIDENARLAMDPQASSEDRMPRLIGGFFILIGGLFMAYLVYRNMYPAAWLESSHELNWKLGGANTIVLICSSITMALAVRALSERDVPDYIEVDDGKLTAKLARVPSPGDVPYAVQMEPHLVVEYYSR